MASRGAARGRGVAAVGWERQDDYLDDRYTRAEDFRFQLDELAAWAKPNLGSAHRRGRHQRRLQPVPLYGDELSNRVQYIGRELPGGDFRRSAMRRAGSCPQLVEAVNDGDYDYVVTAPELDLNDPSTAKPSPERGWLRRAPAAEEVLRRGRVSVFRIDGDLDPADCAQRGPAPKQPAK